jgi:hypothetical protein
MKGGQTCLYVDREPGKTCGTESRVAVDIIPEPSPAPSRQPIPQWQSSPESMLLYSLPVLENRNGEVVESSSYQKHQNTPSTNGYALDGQTNLSPDAAAQQVVSPEISAYAVTTFPLGSGSNDTDSLVARSVSSQPNFNAAITRWFDMLVGDSTFENEFSNFDIDLDDPNNLDTSHQGQPSLPYVRPCNKIPATFGIDATSPSSSSTQLLERTDPSPDRNATIEKLKWQAPTTIELLPYEHLIFRNFVQRVSLWVWFFCDILIGFF